MSLVPAMCSFLAIPCIPCNASAIVMSENKSISNIIAKERGLSVPKDLGESSENGIFRPLNLGSSIGITVGNHEPIKNPSLGTYQEFISGYDITIPIVYNFETEKMALMPAVVYFPKSQDPKWFYSAEEKIKDNGFDILFINSFNDEIKCKILEFIQDFPINTYGRIDARIKCDKSTLTKNMVNEHIALTDLYFIEINSMPTIETDDSFEYSLNIIKQLSSHELHNCVQSYEKNIKHPSINGYLLASSILAYSQVSSSNGL